MKIYISAFKFRKLQQAFENKTGMKLYLLFTNVFYFNMQCRMFCHIC